MPLKNMISFSHRLTPGDCALTLILTVGLFCGADPSPAEVARIQNETLRVGYDGSTGMFSAAKRRGGEMFLARGELEGAGGAGRVESVSDPIFGAGKCIRVERAAGGFASLELY